MNMQLNEAISAGDINALNIDLNDFISEFKPVLLEQLNAANPPVYTPEKANPLRQGIMDTLKRKPFPAQAEVVQAIAALLIDRDEQAGIINAEMGTGKTIMAIALAAVMYAEGYRRFLTIAPPHLVYKWRREILETIPNAKVWVLNGPDTLMKLIKLRQQLGTNDHNGPEFFILGRVRMKMGFHWKLAVRRKITGYLVKVDEETGEEQKVAVSHACCPNCYKPVLNKDKEPVNYERFIKLKSREKCEHCDSPMWSLMRPNEEDDKGLRVKLSKSMCQIPTIGPVKAKQILDKFGDEFIANMLADNMHDFINLMDEKGDLIFNDRQATRMERKMSHVEFGFGEGGYQASEFIKRYLPKDFFDLLIVDEAHEYKNLSSAQGQAMGVLASRTRKSVLLTGTLMGGYAEDLFYLLFRALPRRMIEDGYKPNARGSFASSAMAFMRDHGVLKDIYTQREEGSHKTSKGKKTSTHALKAPGFGPKGIHRYVVPYTVFLKLKDIGADVLPDYKEDYIEIPMTDEQKDWYQKLTFVLMSELRKALAMRDKTLLGVVLNALLAWPDCCFREEKVLHPRTRSILAQTPSLFHALDTMPKEQELIDLCLKEKEQGRKVLIYSTYTDTRDTTERLKLKLTQAGLKIAILKSKNVPTEEREEWIMNRVDEGIDGLICNPEAVKTGLDLLDFATIVFMQTGYNVYTLLQAARRSWRIGQTKNVKVLFFGYQETSQINCLMLMAKKIAVAQSTSGDIPEPCLDRLNVDGYSLEMELAKQLLVIAA